jgi:hypothetical protein
MTEEWPWSSADVKVVGDGGETAASNPEYTWSQTADEVTFEMPVLSARKSSLTATTDGHKLNVTSDRGSLVVELYASVIVSDRAKMRRGTLILTMRKMHAETWPSFERDVQTHGVRIAIVDNDYDSSSSARSTHAGPTDGKECHFQDFLSYFTVSCATGADDAASYDDMQAILGCFIASGTAGAEDSASNDDAPEELDFARLATELVTIVIPPGPVGMFLETRQHEDGFHTTVTSVRATSPVSGIVLTGDIMHTLDGVNVSNLYHTEVTKLIREGMLQQRSLVVKRPTCASVDTAAAAPNRFLPPCISMRTTGRERGFRRSFDGATDSKRVLGKATMGQTQLIG